MVKEHVTLDCDSREISSSLVTKCQKKALQRQHDATTTISLCFVNTTNQRRGCTAKIQATFKKSLKNRVLCKSQYFFSGVL